MTAFLILALCVVALWTVSKVLDRCHNDYESHVVSHQHREPRWLKKAK